MNPQPFATFLRRLIRLSLLPPRPKTRTRLLPVVIQSSSDEQRDRLKRCQDGASSVVRIPAEFADTVARLVVYWLATNQPPKC